MKRITLPALPVLALLASALTGCGAADATGDATEDANEKSSTSSAEPAGKASTNPCDLLSESEVSEALGEPVEAELIDHGEPTGIRQCLWSAVSKTALENYDFSVVRTEDMAQVWRDGGMTAA